MVHVTPDQEHSFAFDVDRPVRFLHTYVVLSCTNNVQQEVFLEAMEDEDDDDDDADGDDDDDCNGGDAGGNETISAVFQEVTRKGNSPDRHSKRLNFTLTKTSTKYSPANKVLRLAETPQSDRSRTGNFAVLDEFVDNQINEQELEQANRLEDIDEEEEVATIIPTPSPPPSKMGNKKSTKTTGSDKSRSRRQASPSESQEPDPTQAKRWVATTMITDNQ